MLATLLTRLRKWLPREEKEDNMAKKKTVVKFKLFDGMKPRVLSEQNGSPIGLKCPMPVKLDKHGSVKINPGVTCNSPLVVVSTMNFSLMSGAQLVAPGEKFSVLLSAGDEPLNVGEGEIIAKAYVIGNDNIEVETK